MSEKTARQTRKEANQYYANVIPFAKTYANQQVKKMGRIRAALKILFKGRLF